VTACSQDCSGYDERLGGELRFHFIPDRLASPWFSLGFGYERFFYGRGSLSSGYYGIVDLDGYDVDFQAGCDVRATRSWTIGSYVGLRVGAYGHLRATGGDYRGSGPMANVDIPESGQAVHEWLTFGVRGTFTHLPQCPWPGSLGCSR
jgi:hypothetical protein